MLVIFVWLFYCKRISHQVDHEKAKALIAKTNNIKAKTLFKATEDVLLRILIVVKSSRSHTCDEANYMAGTKKGTVIQILEEPANIFPINSFAHALNLSVATQKVPFLNNMSTTLKISNLIKFSLKGNFFNKLHQKLALTCTGFRTP